MSKDTIYREDAIEVLAINAPFMSDEAYLKSYDALKSIPSADRPQGEWMPCSERLPKESGEYLVYCEIFFIPDHVDEPSSRKGMAIAYYHREFNEWLGEDKVYAWMSLPEPWKGADDETE